MGSVSQSPLTTSAAVSTLPKAKPAVHSKPAKPTDPVTTPNYGTCVDGDDASVDDAKICKVPPPVPKKPNVKRVSFEETPINTMHIIQPTVQPDSILKSIIAPSTNSTNTACSSNANDSCVDLKNAESDECPIDDYIIPPPPTFDSEPIDIQTVPLPPIPPIDYEEEIPPVNLDTFPKNLAPSDTDSDYVPKYSKDGCDNAIRRAAEGPELIQVHFSSLPTVSHVPNVPCSLHPDLPLRGDDSPHMSQSASFPSSAVSGEYNPFAASKTLPPSKSMDCYERAENVRPPSVDGSAYKNAVPKPYRYTVYTQELDPNPDAASLYKSNPFGKIEKFDSMLYPAADKGSNFTIGKVCLDLL